MQVVQDAVHAFPVACDLRAVDAFRRQQEGPLEPQFAAAFQTGAVSIRGNPGSLTNLYNVATMNLFSDIFIFYPQMTHPCPNPYRGMD